MSKPKNEVHRCAQELMAEGKHVVVFEGAWARSTLHNGDGGMSFVCVVDESVRVPKKLHGDEVLIWMREYLRGARSSHTHVKKDVSVNQYALFREGFVGYITYEGEPNFVYTRKVYAFKNHAPQKIPAHHQVPESPLELYVRPLLTQQEYCEKISLIKEKLSAGETYQVNFSHPFFAPLPVDKNPWNIYKKLAEINPSPYQFYFEVADNSRNSPHESGKNRIFAVISNSPECLMKLNADGEISTRPIKGTIARGHNDEEDAHRAAELLASTKDAAELTMIVDLARNDLGIVCEPCTVEVVRHREIQKYSHLLHTVSTICGKLRAGLDWLDALRAVFPGGSVTGCPKKRTMEIIAELEDGPRGAYCGSAGYIDVSGACEFNILIRTLEWTSVGLKFRSGGGIVFDSDPTSEWRETMQKAAAISTILGAERMS